MLFDQLNKDMVDALKNHEKEKLAVIRMAKGAIQLDSINKKQEITDELVIDAINKQIKLRLDSIIEFEKANRLELVEPVKKEIKVLRKYLPPQLSEEELDNLISLVFDKIKPLSNADMGKIMKEITPHVKGKCDMGLVNVKIKNKLMNLNI